MAARLGAPIESWATPDLLKFAELSMKRVNNALASIPQSGNLRLFEGADALRAVQELVRRHGAEWTE